MNDFVRGGLAMALAGALLLQGCATPIGPYMPDSRTPVTGQTMIQLMPLDMDQSEVGSTGRRQVTNHWLGEADINLSTAIRNTLENRGYAVSLYNSTGADPQTMQTRAQLFALYDAVSDSILAHYYNKDERLPTKSNPLWSLGPSAALLSTSGSRYALFVHFRDEYINAARSVFLLDLQAVGLELTPTRQKGFACLVDLKTGDIIWFHKFHRPSGDLRTLTDAQEAADLLFKNFF